MSPALSEDLHWKGRIYFDGVHDGIQQDAEQDNSKTAQCKSTREKACLSDRKRCPGRRLTSVAPHLLLKSTVTDKLQGKRDASSCSNGESSAGLLWLKRAKKDAWDCLLLRARFLHRLGSHSSKALVPRVAQRCCCQWLLHCLVSPAAFAWMQRLQLYILAHSEVMTHKAPLA